MKKLVDLLR